MRRRRLPLALPFLLPALLAVAAPAGEPPRPSRPPRPTRAALRHPDPDQARKLTMDELLDRLNRLDTRAEAEQKRGEAVHELMRRGGTGAIALAKFFRDDPGQDAKAPATRIRWAAADLIYAMACSMVETDEGPPLLRPEHEDVFRAMLDSPHAEIRTIGALLLGEYAGPETVRALIARLRDASGDVRRAAAASLGRIGDPAALSELLRLAGDEQAAVRERAAAARSLGELGRPAAVETLAGLARTRNEVLVVAAAEALAQLDSPESVPVCAELLDSPWPESRAAALRALAPWSAARLRPKYLALLAEPLQGVEPPRAPGDDPAWKAAYARRLAARADLVRAAAITALGQLEPDAELVARLEALAGAESFEVGYAAVLALGGLARSPRAAAALVAFAGRTPNDFVREQALRELAFAAGSEAAPALAKVLADPLAPPLLRATAAEGLAIRGEFSDEIQEAYRRSVRRVFPEAARPEAEPPGPLAERVALLWALGRSGDRYGAVEAGKALGSAEPEVSRAAAMALAASTHARVAQDYLRRQMVYMLNDPNPTQVRAAGLALSVITGQEFGSDIKRWQAWWTANPELPEEMPSNAWLPLAHVLLDQQQPLALRADALSFLEWLRAGESALMELAARPSGLEDAALRRQAIETLGRMRVRASARVLVETLEIEEAPELVSVLGGALAAVTGHRYRPSHYARPERGRQELVQHWLRWWRSRSEAERRELSPPPAESPRPAPAATGAPAPIAPAPTGPQ